MFAFVQEGDFVEVKSMEVLVHRHSELVTRSIFGFDIARVDGRVDSTSYADEANLHPKVKRTSNYFSVELLGLAGGLSCWAITLRPTDRSTTHTRPATPAVSRIRARPV